MKDVLLYRMDGGISGLLSLCCLGLLYIRVAELYMICYDAVPLGLSKDCMDIHGYRTCDIVHVALRCLHRPQRCEIINKYIVASDTTKRPL